MIDLLTEDEIEALAALTGRVVERLATVRAE
jgi:hypothetical protein